MMWLGSVASSPDLGVAFLQNWLHYLTHFSLQAPWGRDSPLLVFLQYGLELEWAFG